MNDFAYKMNAPDADPPTTHQQAFITLFVLHTMSQSAGAQQQQQHDTQTSDSDGAGNTKKTNAQERAYKKRFDELTKLHSDARHRMLTSHSDKEIHAAMATLKQIGASLGNLNEEFPAVAEKRKERRKKLEAQAERKRRRRMSVGDDDSDAEHDEETFVSQLGNVYSP